MASFYCLKNDFVLAFRLEILECPNFLFLDERYIAVSLNMAINGKVSGGFVLNVDQGNIIILIVISYIRLCINILIYVISNFKHLQNLNCIDLDPPETFLIPYVLDEDTSIISSDSCSTKCKSFSVITAILECRDRLCGVWPYSSVG